MGCCTNLAHFLRTVGVDHLLAAQPKLYFVTPDRRKSVFKADPWPAPFHLGRALTGAHYLTPTDKLRVAYGLLAMLCASPDADCAHRTWDPCARARALFEIGAHDVIRRSNCDTVQSS